MEELSQQHRLISITSIKKSLTKKKLEHVQKTLSRYQKIYNTVNGILVTAGSLAGGSSKVTSSSVANSLITIPVTSVSTILGSIAFVTGVWNGIFKNKVEKYEEYLSTAQAKLNSIPKIL